ncbi:phage integrase SAM-like domain-containing protein [Elizabethkingia anophelis]|uniref:site-specific integrase n=1 Tax=Elizabethkingia anophelis TaxID=1117645 RepID=UPI003786FBDA
MTFKFYTSKSGIVKNINLYVHIDNDIFKFRTPLRIHDEEWDYARKRPKNIYLKKNKILNKKLDRIKVKISEYIHDEKTHKNRISQRNLSRIIKQICIEKQITHGENSLLRFMQTYINNKKELICDSTFKRYKVFYNLIQRFEGFMMKELLISDVNSNFIRQFILFGTEELYSENTLYRTIHFVKTILNFAERKGIRTHVRELNLRREKQKKEVISLTEKEILKIKSTIIPKDLQPAKDWLIISCYTGQRFSDFMKFSKEKLLDVSGKTCIRFIQKKTQKEILLPLHPEVINILQLNRGEFPKPINIQHYNEQIKLIAKLAGINNSLKAKKRIEHRNKKLIVEKWQIISSHIGRRSFATNFYGKIPTPLLMEATGHSTEQIFMRYINTFDNDHIMRLGNYFDKEYNRVNS